MVALTASTSTATGQTAYLGSYTTTMATVVSAALAVAAEGAIMLPRRVRTDHLHPDVVGMSAIIVGDHTTPAGTSAGGYMSTVNINWIFAPTPGVQYTAQQMCDSVEIRRIVGSTLLGTYTWGSASRQHNIYAAIPCTGLPDWWSSVPDHLGISGTNVLPASTSQDYPPDQVIPQICVDGSVADGWIQADGTAVVPRDVSPYSFPSGCVVLGDYYPPSVQYLQTIYGGISGGLHVEVTWPSPVTPPTTAYVSVNVEDSYNNTDPHRWVLYAYSQLESETLASDLTAIATGALAYDGSAYFWATYESVSLTFSPIGPATSIKYYVIAQHDTTGLGNWVDCLDADLANHFVVHCPVACPLVPARALGVWGYVPGAFGPPVTISASTFVDGEEVSDMGEAFSVMGA